MDFDTIKKNRPHLTDYAFIQKVVETNNIQQPVQPPSEPSLLDRITIKAKNSFYAFIENNLFIITIFIILLCFLIYRFIYHRSSKPTQEYESPYFTPKFTVPPEQFANLGRKKKQKQKQKHKYNEHQNDQMIPIVKEIKNQSITQDEIDDEMPKILNITKDRMFAKKKENLALINSSSYAPSNLQNLGNYYSWNKNDYKLI
jgi:hypothetical protein